MKRFLIIGCMGLATGLTLWVATRTGSIPPGSEALQSRTDQSGAQLPGDNSATLTATPESARSRGARDARPTPGREEFRQSCFEALESGSDAEALRAIRGFAELGDESAFRVLMALAGDEAWPIDVRLAAVRVLMHSGDPNRAIRAVRCLASADGRCVPFLRDVMRSGEYGFAVRTEAARALASLGGPEAATALREQLAAASGMGWRSELTECLARLPYEEVSGDFQSLLDPAIQAPEDRSMAAEALASSSEAALSLLESVATSDPDPEVRENATWAMSMVSDGSMPPNHLVSLIAAEADPDVRRRLYELSTVQREADAEILTGLLDSEEEPATRIAALNAIGMAIRTSGDLNAAARFDSQHVPELVRTAGSSRALNLRMRAVFALRRAATPAAQSALASLASNPTPQIAKAAARALPSNSIKEIP